ncbi:MAG TPA: ribbon-helix-helix protein, CopG family [Acidimicrobiales bacterium]|nr:ribbon-helix-helix protein, CopG family [Acidimicrobiales bacterium]
MQRTTIMADEPTLAALRELARERQVSFAAVVREALEEKARSFRPRPTSLGAGASSRASTGRTAAARRQPPRSWR